MYNIWEFFCQTLTVSVTAGLLLLVKGLFRDKLSPRFQYGIFSVLALRILLPVDTSRHILLPIPLWTELLKSYVEASCNSVYSSAYLPFSMNTGFFPAQMPQSITDWIFVLYLIGVIFFLLRYSISYLRLRLLLKHAAPASDLTTAQLKRICRKYHVKACKAVQLEGLPSAFICGVIKPVLALPADRLTDDKILLHELLHHRYLDTLQSIFWAILRSLHWCNPFLHYVFDCISNDMEALCDQRVLERLEGEERRAYGSLLLAMANEKYASFPGTTSISNGGKNISRRIAAIVRFKKYPRNMALVSVSIGIVLAMPILTGNKTSYAADFFSPHSTFALSQAIAVSRLSRCTTIAGALDTYAKGLMLQNGVYIATASPLSKQKEIISAMSELYTLENGLEFKTGTVEQSYAVYNLKQLDENTFHAFLAFSFADRCIHHILIPVQISYSDDCWNVTERAERQVFISKNDYPLVFPYLSEIDLPFLQACCASGESGTITIKNFTSYTVNNSLSGSMLPAFDFTPKPDAEFEYAYLLSSLEYQYNDNSFLGSPDRTVGIQYAEVSSEKEALPLPDVNMTGSVSGGGSINGYEMKMNWFTQNITDDWNGLLFDESGGGHDMTDGMINLPPVWKARVFWDGVAVEELTLLPQD